MSNGKSSPPKKSYFESRYVTFSQANVSVDLKKFLATPKGRAVVENAVKRVHGTSMADRAGTLARKVAKSATAKVTTKELDDVAA